MSVKVRFAPSPTGMLHIGNARAALINWLFARKNKGQFMLRIDDTDLARSEKQYEEAIYQDLAWLGLTHDQLEHQSSRFDRYQEVLEYLKTIGRVYPCYESAEELDFKRKRQLSRGEPPIYDRAALKLTDEEKNELNNKGIKPHWRFLLKDEEVFWEDSVRRHVHFPAGTLSDPVIVRADGVFLYTFASVIDDIDFKITHIIRGEDHVTNTAVQIDLFKTLNPEGPLPQFAHTTLLTDQSGAGFSKRLGSLSLANLRDEGIDPIAIASLLARLGTSLPIEPHSSLDELAQGFDLSIFSRTPPKFSVDDLWQMNQKILHLMGFEKVKESLPEWVTEHIWNILKENIIKLEDIKKWQPILFGDIQDPQQDIDKEYIKTALSFLPAEPWTEETWAKWTNLLKEKTGYKGKQLFMPLRQALTGMDHGPEMKHILPLIGYDKASKRLASI